MPIILNRRQIVFGAVGAVVGVSLSHTHTHADATVTYAKAISPCWPSSECARVVVKGKGADAINTIRRLAGGGVAGGRNEASWAILQSNVERAADILLLVGKSEDRGSLRRSSSERAFVVDLSGGNGTNSTTIRQQITVGHDLAAMLLVQGYVGVDFEDIRVVLGRGGKLGVEVAVAAGEDRTTKAAATAATRLGPMLESAAGVLVSLAFGQGPVKLSESKMAMNLVRAGCPLDAHVVYGTSTDAQLPDGHVRVSLLACLPSLEQGRRRADSVAPLCWQEGWMA